MIMASPNLYMPRNNSAIMPNATLTLIMLMIMIVNITQLEVTAEEQAEEDLHSPRLPLFMFGLFQHLHWPSSHAELACPYNCKLIYGPALSL